MYGGGTPVKEPRLLLMAVELTVAHPRTGKPMKFRIDAPAEFEGAVV